MPSYNRARKFGGGGGALGALLSGILEHYTEAGVVPNDVGPDVVGDYSDAKTKKLVRKDEPFKASNWLARPNVQNLNNQYLLDVKASERQTSGQKELETHRTNEGLRGRREGLPLIAPEEEARTYGTGKGQLRIDKEGEPFRQDQKIFDSSVGVVSGKGIIPSRDNIGSYDTTMTEPILARELQGATTATAQSMAAQDLAGIQARRAQRMEGPELDNALQRARLEGSQIEADQEVLPIETEARKKIAPLRPEAIRSGIMQNSIMPLSPGTGAYEINTGRRRFSAPSGGMALPGFPGNGSYQSQTSADSQPDEVTETGQSAIQDPNDAWVRVGNEFVNLVTKKRVPIPTN